MAQVGLSIITLTFVRQLWDHALRPN